MQGTASRLLRSERAERGAEASTLHGANLLRNHKR